MATKPLFPNWKAIRETISSPFLRIALYTATGDELDALQHAFPRCFSKDQNDLRVPASLIRQQVMEIANLEHNDPDRECEHFWSEALESFGIPRGFSWSNDSDHPERTSIPTVVMEQLKDLVVRCGTTLVYEEETFIVTWYLDESGTGGGLRMGEATAPQLSVTHARFIDLES